MLRPPVDEQDPILARIEGRYVHLSEIEAAARAAYLAAIEVMLKPLVNDPQGLAVLDGLKNLGFTGAERVRVGKRIDPDSASFEVTEKALLPEGSLYVNGKLDEHNRIGTPSWTSLILSPKTRDELMSGSAQTAKMLLIGGAAACGVGAIVSVVGALMA